MLEARRAWQVPRRWDPLADEDEPWPALDTTASAGHEPDAPGTGDDATPIQPDDGQHPG